MTTQSDRLAFDRATVRTVDVDGRLHVEVSNISKAAVNPYLGSEIPGSELLGLDPSRVYQLLRDPEELAKAAPTFNNLPLLSKHVPVSAADHQPDIVVGSTGTDAEFIAPYLRNSLVVWEAVAIAGINSGEQKELSSAYRYVPVMKPGVYQGVAYDGVMTEIVGNHVALVVAGRAGSDVVVGDSNPFANLEKFDMKKASRKAIAVRAALGAFLRSKLAQDAAIGDLGALVRDVKAATQEQDAERIGKAVIAATTGKLAADTKLDLAELRSIVKIAADEAPDDEVEAMDEDDEDEEEAKKKKAKKEGAEDKGDEEDEDEKESKSKKAMDAAIKVAAENAEKSTIARMNAIRQAEREVQPFVGEVAAMDSAEAVYKLALDSAGVDLSDVPPTAYRALVRMLPKPGSKPAPIAQDSADGMTAFKAMFPTAVLPIRS